MLSFEYRTVMAIIKLQQLGLTALRLPRVSHRLERGLTPPILKYCLLKHIR